MYESKSLNEFKSWVVLSIAAIILSAIIPLLLWGSAFSKGFITLLTPLSSFLVVCFLIYTTEWSYKKLREVFLPWLLLSVGMGLYFLANILFYVFNMIGTVFAPSVSDFFYLAGYPLLIAGVLLFLKKPYKIQYKNLLDVIIIIISLFFIVWFYFIWPTVEPSQPDTFSVIISISYLFLDLLFLIVVLTVLFNENKKIAELPLAFLSIGLFFQIFGDMTYAYQTLNPSLVNQWILSILYTSNSIFALLGILSFLKNIKIDLNYVVERCRITRPENFWISFFPLILVLLTYSLLIITTPDEALIWGVGIIIILVILREIISLIEIRKAQIVLKRNKELISKKEEQLSFITTNMADLITESNQDGIYRYVSQSSSQLLGISPEDLMGRLFYDFIHANDLEKVSESLKKAKELHSSARLKYRYKNVAGEYIWMETIAKPVFDHDMFKGFIYSSRDVTEQIKAEKFVKNSLNEKEALLREIHHRVNNNLQIISSLLSLQSKHVVNKSDKELFKESQNRVRTMAMIHEKLYQSDNLSSINFFNYLKTLLNNLVYDYSHDLSEINLKLDIGDIELNIETSVPCGLIINELVTNSLKHAFTPGSHGTITIKMQEENDNYVLIVADDGAKYSSESSSDLTNSEKLGLELVNSLVKQLDGTMETFKGKGTTFKIIFKELKYKKRI